LGVFIRELARLAREATESLVAETNDLRRADSDDPWAVVTAWSRQAAQCMEPAQADERYHAALAELTNRWADLRLALQPLVDNLLDAMGMPTHQSLADTQAALDRLRRRQRQETDALTDRVAGLEARLDTPDRTDSSQ